MKDFWSTQKFFDIAANLSDERFFGKYYGKDAHKEDFDLVISRAKSFGVNGFLFASGHIEDALTSLDLCQRTANSYGTIGIHPCRAAEPYIRAKLPKEGASPE
jgi:TatD DNase family protein